MLLKISRNFFCVFLLTEVLDDEWNNEAVHPSSLFRSMALVCPLFVFFLEFAHFSISSWGIKIPSLKFKSRHKYLSDKKIYNFIFSPARKIMFEWH